MPFTLCHNSRVMVMTLLLEPLASSSTTFIRQPTTTIAWILLTLCTMGMKKVCRKPNNTFTFNKDVIETINTANHNNVCAHLVVSAQHTRTHFNDFNLLFNLQCVRYRNRIVDDRDCPFLCNIYLFVPIRFVEATGQATRRDSNSTRPSAASKHHWQENKLYQM